MPLMFTVNLLAQATSTDPISGGAGWAGAGLLGLVLAWLLFIHLPAREKSNDALLKSLVEANTKAIETQRETVKQLTVDFRATLKDVAEHCQEEMTRVATSWHREMDNLRQIFSKEK